MAQYADGADFGKGQAVRFAHNQNVLHGVQPQGGGPAGSVLAFHMASPMIWAGNHPPQIPGAAAAAQHGLQQFAPQHAAHGVQPQTGFHPQPMAAPHGFHPSPQPAPQGFHPQPLPAPVAAPYAPQGAPTPQPAPQGLTTLPGHVSAAPGFGAVGPEGTQPNSPLASILAQIFSHAFSTQPVSHDTF